MALLFILVTFALLLFLILLAVLLYNYLTVYSHCLLTKIIIFTHIKIKLFQRAETGLIQRNQPQ